jgi:hypothetical protein
MNYGKFCISQISSTMSSLYMANVYQLPILKANSSTSDFHKSDARNTFLQYGGLDTKFCDTKFLIYSLHATMVAKFRQKNFITIFRYHT